MFCVVGIAVFATCSARSLQGRQEEEDDRRGEQAAELPSSDNDKNRLAAL